VVAEQRAVAAAIQATDAKTLIFEGHNNNRFYFWTGTSPATPANPTFWPRMLTARERDQILERLERPGKYCVVRVPNYALFYDARSEPLQQRLREGWQKYASVGDWEIGVVDVH
jgi:hypothetical protein